MTDWMEKACRRLRIEDMIGRSARLWTPLISF